MVWQKDILRLKLFCIIKNILQKCNIKKLVNLLISVDILSNVLYYIICIILVEN